MAEFSLKRLSEADEKELKRIDDFLMEENTGGEFVNTIKYLSYHPEGRFTDDTVFVVDKGSAGVRGVMVAAVDPDDEKHIVSHPGTSFAGPVVSRKQSIETNEIIINMMLDYYETNYNQVTIRIRPEFFDKQPMRFVDYFLLRRGYAYGMVGLSNVINLDGVSSGDDILALYDSKKRNQVRKVLKNERFIFSELQEVTAESWASMNETLGDKHGVRAVHTLEEINRLKSMFPNNIGIYYANTPEGKYGALGIVYKYKNTFHTQYLDTNYEYTGEYPNLLIFYNLMVEAVKEGYERFSIGISTENHGELLNYGLYDYKDGYGGGSVIQPVYTKRIK